MAGGQAQTETWDPKRYTPFEPGMNPNTVLSTFQPINTNVDHIKISEGLEQCAQVMHLGTLMRTFRPGDLGKILHSRHQFHFHTGYVPPQTVNAPSMGGYISRALGPRHPDVPAFIDIGQRFDVGGEDFEVKTFHTAGFGADLAEELLEHDAAVAVDADVDAAVAAELGAVEIDLHDLRGGVDRAAVFKAEVEGGAQDEAHVGLGERGLAGA
jgi:hypothetical protein